MSCLPSTMRNIFSSENWMNTPRSISYTKLQRLWWYVIIAGLGNQYSRIIGRISTAVGGRSCGCCHSALLNPMFINIYVICLNVILDLVVVRKVSVVVQDLPILGSWVHEKLNPMQSTLGMCWESLCISARMALPRATKSRRVFPQMLSRNYSLMKRILILY